MIDIFVKGMMLSKSVQTSSGLKPTNCTVGYFLSFLAIRPQLKITVKNLDLSQCIGMLTILSKD
jgi:hypothetical protein